METSPRLKFKADGQFVHYALFHPSTDGQLKTQSLVVPYILAFKGETPAHGSYCVNGEVKPSCELVTKNQYPTYCNVISGLESAEQILQIYSSTSKKVFYFFSPLGFVLVNCTFFFFRKCYPIKNKCPHPFTKSFLHDGQQVLCKVRLL